MSLHHSQPDVDARSPRASERAYARLRDEILDWTLAPGIVLGEVEMAARLGVSRTPVREALFRLASEGLLETHPGRGLIVTVISADRVNELFELRDALETASARLASRRRDPAVFEALRLDLAEAPAIAAAGDRDAYYDIVRRLDDALDAAASNGFLTAALTNLRTHLSRLRRLAQDDALRLADAAGEHLLIVDAILAQDEELAASAVRAHLFRSRRYLLSAIADHDFTPRPAR